MNLLKQIAFCLCFAITIVSCTGPTEEGSSTDIDSTNLEGKAPATYGADDPTNPDAPIYEGGMDTAPPALTTQGDSTLR